MTARTRWAMAGLIPLSLLTLAVHETPPPDGCRLIRGAATAELHDDDVQVCRVDTWFHGNETRLGNTAVTGQTSRPSFNTDPPAGAFAGDGAGAMTAGSGISSQHTALREPGTLSIEGSFTGDIDNIAVELYLLAGARQIDASFAFAGRLTIDGVALPLVTEAPHRAALTEATTTGDVPVRVGRFAITNVYNSMELNGLDLGPDAQHTVRIEVTPTYAVNDVFLGFLYDAHEVPSGAVFNLPPNQLFPYSLIQAG